MSRDFWCLRYVINDHRIGDNLQMIYKRRVHAWRGGVVNQMIKNIVQSKRPRSVKKTRLRINISWIIDLPEVVASSFSKFGHTNRTLFFDWGGNFQTKSREISAHWNAPFLQIFLVSTPFIALKPSQILRSAILSYNCSWRLNWIWQDFPFALHKTFHAIRYETRFCVGIQAWSRSTAIRGQ